jgi:crotonobetainyl-CoA:carnitine CoA-transferase CaiB-like acyl-CoA transferase
MSRDPRWAPLHHAATGPLAGYRVLDMSAFAVGPWAASLLAGLGADVVKIDPPYGDHIRRVKPSRAGEGTTYTVCNLGKRDIELDLKNPAHKKIAYELAAECDVLIENSREGAMTRLGFGYEELSDLNPGLVYCSSSSFGSWGPMATVGSTDPQGQAFTGFVSIQGDQGADPEFLRYFAAVDLGTSAYLTQAVLAGLYLRSRTGKGCAIKTSQMEGALALQTTKTAEYLVAGHAPAPMGSATTAFVPSEAFLCRDSRYLNVSAPDEPSWRRLCAVVGLPDLPADPRFATNLDRVAHRGELLPLLRAKFLELDSTWWRGRLREQAVPNATELVLDDLMRGTGAEPASRFLNEVPHSVSGRMNVVKPVWRFGRTPAQQSAAPVPGQHNADFLSLPASEDDPGDVLRPDHPVTGDESVDLPLEGVRVVELAQGVAGPYCGWLLKSLGAEVTKVEPAGGDYTRGWAPADASGEGAAFRALNRGKRGVVAGQGIADLLDTADVIVADVGAGWLGVEDLEQVLDAQAARGAVVCRISPTGSDDVAATELEVQALAGLTRYVGAIGEAPVRVGADLAMTLAGAFGLQGILAALLEKQTSGLGQTVEVSALGALLAIMSVMVAALDDPAEWGGFHCLAAAYPRDRGVTTSDGAISFSSPRRSNEAWVALCHELGADALAENENYLTDDLRTPRSKELNRELAKYTVKLPAATVLEATHRHGGLGVPVQTYGQLFAHPQAQAMDLSDTSEGYTSLAAPWRVNGLRPHLGGRPPRLGEHGVSESGASEHSASESSAPTSDDGDPT